MAQPPAPPPPSGEDEDDPLPPAIRDVVGPEVTDAQMAAKILEAIETSDDKPTITQAARRAGWQYGMAMEPLRLVEKALMPDGNHHDLTDDGRWRREGAGGQKWAADKVEVGPSRNETLKGETPRVPALVNVRRQLKAAGVAPEVMREIDGVSNLVARKYGKKIDDALVQNLADREQRLAAALNTAVEKKVAERIVEENDRLRSDNEAMHRHLDDINRNMAALIAKLGGGKDGA